MNVSIEAVCYPEETTWQSYLVQSHGRKQRVGQWQGIGY